MASGAITKPLPVEQPDAKSYGDGQPKWARVLRALYSAQFLDWRAWGDMFSKWGLQEDELAATVEWMEDRGMPQPETAKALRQALYARRDKERQATGGRVETVCARCGGRGAFVYWPDVDFASTEFRNASDVPDAVFCATMWGYSATTICLCEVGRKILSKSPHYANMSGTQMQSLIEASEKWAKQADYVARMLAQWGARHHYREVGR
jgi:hypothetical protein